MATKTSITRFNTGLQKYNLTYEQLIDECWTYYGGDYGSHIQYFTTLSSLRNKQGQKKKPPLIIPNVNNCVCGTKILRKCYIKSPQNDDILVIGSCCIKRFLPKHKQNRTCQDCAKPHRSIKDNLCKRCRENRFITVVYNYKYGSQTDKIRIYCSRCTVKLPPERRDKFEFCRDCNPSVI